MKLVNYTKAQLGAIGEHLVAVNLLAKGWDAILANMSISNVMRYDIVCVDPLKSKTRLVQVKTSVGKNIPIGFTLRNAIPEILQELHLYILHQQFQVVQFQKSMFQLHLLVSVS